MTRFKKPGFLKVFDRTEEKEDRPLLDSESGLFTALELPSSSDLSQKLSAVEDASPVRTALAPPSIATVSEKRPERVESQVSSSPGHLLAIGGKTYSNRRLCGKQASERKMGKMNTDDIAKHIGELPALSKQPLNTDESKGTSNSPEGLARGKEKNGILESGKSARLSIADEKATSEMKSKRRFLGRLQQKDANDVDASDSESEPDVRRPEYEATVKQVAAVEGADSFAQISLEVILPDIRSSKKSDTLETVSEENRKIPLESGDKELHENNQAALELKANEMAIAPEQSCNEESNTRCINDSAVSCEVGGGRLVKEATEIENDEVGSNHRKYEKQPESANNSGPKHITGKESDGQNPKCSENPEKRVDSKDRIRHRREKTGAKSRAKSKGMPVQNVANEGKKDLNQIQEGDVLQGDASTDSSIKDEVLLALGIKKGGKSEPCGNSNRKQGNEAKISVPIRSPETSLVAEVMQALGIKEKKEAKNASKSGRKPKRRHSDKGGSAELVCEEGEECSKGVIGQMLQQDNIELYSLESKALPLARPRMLRASSDKTLLSTFDPSVLEQRPIAGASQTKNSSQRNTEAEVLEALTRLRQEALAKKEKSNTQKKDGKSKARTDRSEKNGRKGKANLDGAGQKRSGHTPRRRASTDGHMRNDCPSPTPPEIGNSLSFDNCPNTPHSSQSAERSVKGSRRRSIEISPVGAQRSPRSSKVSGRRKSLANMPPSPRIAEDDARNIMIVGAKPKNRDKCRDLLPLCVANDCAKIACMSSRCDAERHDKKQELCNENENMLYTEGRACKSSNGDTAKAKIVETVTEWKRPNPRADHSVSKLSGDDMVKHDARSVQDISSDMKSKVEEVPFVSMFSMVAEKSNSNLDFEIERETELGDTSSFKIDDRHLEIVRSLVTSTATTDLTNRQFCENTEEGYHLLKFELADSRIRLHESRLQVQRLEKEILVLKDQLATF